MLRQLVAGAGRVGRVVAREQGMMGKVIGRPWVAESWRAAASGFHTSIPHWRADTEETEPSTAEVADFDKPQERTVGNEKVLKIADEILSLSMLEAHDLMEVLKDRLGITGQPMYGVGAGAMPAGAAAADAAPEEEKTEFDVKLEGFDASAKIKIIKEIRGVTDLGLKEAKELVEGAPCVIKKGLKKEEAEEVAEKLKAAGATVALE